MNPCMYKIILIKSATFLFGLYAYLMLQKISERTSSNSLLINEQFASICMLTADKNACSNTQTYKKIKSDIFLYIILKTNLQSIFHQNLQDNHRDSNLCLNLECFIY